MGQENAIFTHYSIQNKAFQPILMCHQIASSRQCTKSQATNG